LYTINLAQTLGDVDKFNIKTRIEGLVDKFKFIDTGETIEGVEKGGYFIAMDTQDFDLDFVKAYERDCEGEGIGRSHRPREAIFRKDGNKFGAHVSFPHTESEFGECIIDLCSVFER
jgi:hypothetical protein